MRISVKKRQEIKEKLKKGEYEKVEKEIYKEFQEKAANLLQEMMEEVTNSQEGYKIARKIANKEGYGLVRKREVNVTTITGDQIKINSWYGLKTGKKRGRKKAGPNGRGSHILLRYWGFIGLRSIGNAMKVARTGASCQSYDLASKELKEQGYEINSVTVNKITQKIGGLAQKSRTTIALSPEENFTGKRIMIAIDGGRIRTREKKVGRYKKGQKQASFDANWREPKLLVIAEIDEEGKMRKNRKPIYEATMGDHHEIFKILEGLSKNCKLPEAKEIILSGDGAPWIWNKFQNFAENLDIKDKVTEVLDFYHATEHLSEICDENRLSAPKAKKKWYTKLVYLLRTGRYQELENEILEESKIKNLPEIKKKFEYFQRNKSRLQYDKYEQKKIPIGSGIVESAVRRVINLKLKSPSTYWNIENLEKILQLRCILMADRWSILVSNLLHFNRFFL